MASVFKRKYAARTGRIAECSRYTVAFSDSSDSSRASSIVRQVPGFAHKAASIELGNKLEKLAGLRAAREPMDPELRRYMDALPAKLRGKLARWGLLDQTAEAAARPLTEHVAAYEQALRDGIASAKQRGRPATPKHVQNTGNRIRTMLAVMSARTFSDITPGAVGRCLRKLQEKGARRKGVGAKSCAHYYGALNAFLCWSAREKLCGEHPLRDMTKPDATPDGRHARRAFEPDEVSRLLQAARTGPEHFGMTGSVRAVLYRLAAESGLRAGELRALSRANLNLDGAKPTATVPAASAKNRRERTVPLKADMAADLRALVGSKLPTARVFRLPRPENMVKMLRADLERAGIAYENDAGRYADFHSLRVTFATNLIAAGVNVKTAQELLGHSTPTMTLGVYAKVLRGSHEDAIRRLPSCDRPDREAGRATGTDDTTPGRLPTVVKTAQDRDQDYAPSVRDGARQRGKGDAARPDASNSHDNDLQRTALHGNALRSREREMTPTGFEPVLPG